MNGTINEDTVSGDWQHDIDPNVFSVLPDVKDVLKVDCTGQSAWAKRTRIRILNTSGMEESYFLKVSTGPHGKNSLKGEFESTLGIHSIVPDFCPKPIAWGTLQNDPNSHFYLCKFYEFDEGMPDPKSFCEQLAKLHSHHSSPNGNFGFHFTTYNGDIPQDNTWSDSWETFFSKGLSHILDIREERGGPDPELDALLPTLFSTVIPRLLRPLETKGRKIKPSLVHGDLWYGNAGIVKSPNKHSIIYDPSSFWAHNEYELGNWRPERNRFGQEYSQAYHSHIDKSDPKEDYDDRNALYALRFNLHAATLFPRDMSYLKMAKDEIRRLNIQYEAH